MKILFDYQTFSNQKVGGVTRYFCELIRHLRRLEGRDVSVLAGFYLSGYLHDDPSALGDSISGVPLPSWTPVSRGVSLANRCYFGCARRFQRPDIYHLTYFNWLQPRWRVKRIVNVHDMIPERFPALYGPSNPVFRRKKYAVEHVDGIICASESTKKDLVEFLRVPEEKIRVVHYGTSLQKTIPVTARADGPYFLYVGQRGGYKNFSVIPEAFRQSRDLKGNFRLVCFGGGPFNSVEQRQFAECGMVGKVDYITGNDSLLAGLYERAAALIYPSLYEGFGFPVLEAMAMGCPVLTVRRSSIPEIVGDAGLYFEPEHADDLVARVVGLLSDAGLRQSLVEKGRQRAKLFSWESCADKTADFYDAMTGSK